MNKLKEYFNRRNLIFIVIFTVLGLIALQIPFTNVIGSKTKFTLFDFFGPIATGFIGVVPGIISIFLMQLINLLIHGVETLDAAVIVRFFPVLFAAFYFGKRNTAHIAIPLIAIIAFNLHPVGRTAWYYSLYWIIPIVCYFARSKSLFARSLGTTFTAHAVGGALWIYFVNPLSKEIWTSLVPITAAERLMFAIGITVMYVVINNVIEFIAEKRIADIGLLVDKKYTIGRFLKKSH